MKIFKYKKAIDEGVLTVIVVIIVLVYLSTVLLAKINTFKAVIGEEQISILNAAQEAQKTQLFVQLAGRYSVAKAILDLAENNGFYKPICGKYNDIPYWNKVEEPKKLCFNNVYESVQLFILERFNQLAEKKGLLKNHYELFVEDNHVVGVALKPYTLTLEKPNGAYSVPLGFDVLIKTRFDLYASVQKYSENLIKSCAGTKSSNAERDECIKNVFTEKLEEQGISLIYEQADSNNFLFTAITNFKPAYSNNFLEWKLALFLPVKNH
ncbi:hypothetical protein HYV79_04965 [Candidatus Woesearchaeota archaeon]|nr:hypothetical protein [Candidatus Woesearchaeota archaeon]